MLGLLTTMPLLLASLSDMSVLTELLRVAQDPKVVLILGVFKMLKLYFKQSS
jgi:hypothetical protein